MCVQSGGKCIRQEIISLITQWHIYFLCKFVGVGNYRIMPWRFIFQRYKNHITKIMPEPSDFVRITLSNYLYVIDEHSILACIIANL